MTSRYRSLMLLAAVLLVQLLLLAYQLRRNQDIPLIRLGTALVVTPMQKGLRAFFGAAGELWQGYVDLRGARRQSETLAREVDQLKLENQQLREQAEQGRRLQVLLDLRQQVPSPTVVAQVISASSSETARLLTIDKGQNAGIRPDLPVLVPDGIVGKVLHAFPNSAQVLLLTDPYSGVACLLENSRVHGVLKGQNKPLGSLAYVPNGEPVEIGQRVFTSGEDQIYPKGLPVGVVVEARPGPEFQQITVQPFAPLNRLEEVLVLLLVAAAEPQAPIASAGGIAPPSPNARPAAKAQPLGAPSASPQPSATRPPAGQSAAPRPPAAQPPATPPPTPQAAVVEPPAPEPPAAQQPPVEPAPTDPPAATGSAPGEPPPVPSQ